MNLDECVLFVIFSLLFVKYHSNACYEPYTLRVDKKNETKIDIKIKMNTTKAENGDIIHSTPRLERRKADDSTITR